MFRTWLHEILTRRYPGISFDILVPPDPAMGDFSTNIAMVAKKDAKEICDALMADGAERIAKCDVAGPGFVNIFLKDEYLRARLGVLDLPKIGQGKKVIVEYSAPNIAKPMSVGHLRSTIIGDALANVHKALGYDVIRWNYIGDWGTQFGKLIAAYRRYGGEKQELTVENLVAMYVRFHAEEAEHPELATLGQEEFHKLEMGDAPNRALWQTFRNESLQEFQRMYTRLGVTFDVIKGESDYESALAGVVASLKPLLTASEGAQVIILDETGLPPALIVKTDGSSIYLVRDIASLEDRINTYHPAAILYIVGNEQSLHFEQLFAIKEKMKLGDTTTVHVKFGMVLGENGKKFSTRQGNVVLLDDVLDEVVRRAGERNAETAEAIGIGALKYNDLKQHPHTDIVFDWDAMLDLKGNSGPYLQYTYARLASIVVKAGEPGATADRATLTHPAERALLRHLIDYGWAVSQCAKLYALNGLALYLYELAVKANHFYEAVRINDDDNTARKSARLELIAAVMRCLKDGLGLLGISAPERI